MTQTTTTTISRREATILGDTWVNGSLYVFVQYAGQYGVGQCADDGTITLNGLFDSVGECFDLVEAQG